MMDPSSSNPASAASYKDLKQRYTSVFESGSIPTLNELRSQGTSGQLAATDAPLRFIYWQLYFSHFPLQDPTSWPILLSRRRSEYSQSRRKRLRAPDGSYPPETGLSIRDEEFQFNTADPISSNASLSRTGTVVKDLRVNNPLSLDEETPWKSHYASKELRATISTDVERAFPDNPLFRLTEVQRSLSNLILVWCLMNPEIGYRQGIHELAGAVWYVRKRESVKVTSSIQKDEIDQRLGSILDEKYIEHDAFSILSAILQNAKSWYEWRETSHLPKGPGNTSNPAPAPIVVKCERIHATLKVVDPALASHLESLSIEPQLYALRWIRLMFTREFRLEDALQIWDGIFSEDTSLALVDFICIAMLERIRSKILSSDYSGVLQTLLHCPTQSSAGKGSDHPSLLVQQALRLREVTSPATGVEIVYQNRDLLGIQLHPATLSASSVPDLNAPLPSRRSGMAHTVATGRSQGQRAPLPRLNSSQSQNLHSSSSGSFPSLSVRDSLDPNQEPSQTPATFSPTSYLPEGLSDLARGIFERSDALGINKALVSSLSNVQKTVEAYAARNQSGPLNDQPFGPGAEESVRARRAALNQPIASINPTAQVTGEASRNSELEALKETNKAMGAAVAACVEVFERQWVQSEQSSLEAKEKKDENETTMKSASIETLMSLCAMKHVRDVLLGVATEFDPAILTSPEKASKDLPSSDSPSLPPAQSSSVPHNSSISSLNSSPSSSSPLKSTNAPQTQSQAQHLARHRAFARVDDSNSNLNLPSSNPSMFATYQNSQARSKSPLPQSYSSSTSSSIVPPKYQPRIQASNLKDPLNSSANLSSSSQHPPSQPLPPSQPSSTQPSSRTSDLQPRSAPISSAFLASHAGTTARREGPQRTSIINPNSNHSNPNDHPTSSSYPPPTPLLDTSTSKLNEPLTQMEIRSDAPSGRSNVGFSKGLDPLGAS